MWRGLATTVALAVAILLVIAWPVIVSPAEQIYGAEIVGRHHDPFTVMRQMAGDGARGPYRQPATDDLGWLLARVLPPVAAYNVVVLITFPLTAAAVYALARYLTVPHTGAVVAALFFTFAPLRLAHAAYHPHVVQTHWIALYLLALSSALDRPTVIRLVALLATGTGLVLSNFYGGLIGAVLTPVCVVAYWATSPGVRSLRGPIVVSTTLGVAGAAAIVAIRSIYPDLTSSATSYGFPIDAVAEHSAQWWAYLVPSVLHPVFGLGAAGWFAGHGVTRALVEQQVYVSYALITLAVIGLGAVLARWKTSVGSRVIAGLSVVASAAWVASLAPATDTCTAESWALACHLHALAPMFRAYARFAFVVHLGVAIAAGFGVAWLVDRRAEAETRRRTPGRIAAVILVTIAAFEYWPLPARARDVLPSEGHRWLATQRGRLRAIDCVEASLADANTAWLTGHGLGFLGGPVATCRDPFLGPKLAALGYTHVIVRRPDRADTLALLDRPSSGLATAADFTSARVYAVTATAPPVIVTADTGFLEYEHDEAGTWRWMADQAAWVVDNTSGVPLRVVLELRLESIHEPRRLDVRLDDGPTESLSVGVRTSSYLLGPWLLSPGRHNVTFRAGGEPFQPSTAGVSRDSRALAVAFHDRSWMPIDAGPEDDR